MMAFDSFVVDVSNFYAQPNGREFDTNEQEMRTFLGISYIMSIKKLQMVMKALEILSLDQI